MQKQTSPILLRLGFNRGWFLNFFSYLKFYLNSLKLCLFLFLLCKAQLIKRKYWVVFQYIFLTFKECVVKVFFWKFFSKFIKKNKIFFILRKKTKLILKNNIFLNLKNIVFSLKKLKKYLRLKKKIKIKFNFIKKKKNYIKNFKFKLILKKKLFKINKLKLLKKKNRFLNLKKKLKKKKKFNINFFWKVMLLKKRFFKNSLQLTLLKRKNLAIFNLKLKKFKNFNYQSNLKLQKIKNFFKWKILKKNDNFKFFLTKKIITVQNKKLNFKFKKKQFKNFKFKKKKTLTSRKKTFNKKKLVLSFFFFKKFQSTLNFYFFKKGFFFLLNKKKFLTKFIKTQKLSKIKLKKKIKILEIKYFFFKFFFFKSFRSLNFFKKYSIIFLNKFKVKNFNDFLKKLNNSNVEEEITFSNFFEKFRFFSLWYTFIDLIKFNLKTSSNFFNFILSLKNNKKNIKKLNYKLKTKKYTGKIIKVFFKNLIEQIYFRIWEKQLREIAWNFLKNDDIEVCLLDSIQYFRKSLRRVSFEKRLVKNLKRKPPFSAKALLVAQPLLIFNLIKIIGLVFKIIGTVGVLNRYLAIQIKMTRKHWQFTKLVENILNSYWKKYSKKIVGCKIALIGKINGSSRTRKMIIEVGKLNIQRFFSDIDYSLSESYSLFGIFGIKTWLQFY